MKKITKSTHLIDLWNENIGSIKENMYMKKSLLYKFSFKKQEKEMKAWTGLGL